MNQTKNISLEIKQLDENNFCFVKDATTILFYNKNPEYKLNKNNLAKQTRGKAVDISTISINNLFDIDEKKNDKACSYYKTIELFKSKFPDGIYITPNSTNPKIKFQNAANIWSQINFHLKQTGKSQRSKTPYQVTTFIDQSIQIIFCSTKNSKNIDEWRTWINQQNALRLLINKSC